MVLSALLQKYEKEKKYLLLFIYHGEMADALAEKIKEEQR